MKTAIVAEQTLQKLQMQAAGTTSLMLKTDTGVPQYLNDAGIFCTDVLL
jgi:hypothetical protein